MNIPKKPVTLSAQFVQRVNRPGRYGDGRGGHGLSLLVKKMTSTGRWSKSWCQRVRIAGKPSNVGLGSFPRVTLAAARAKALENVRMIENGEDPRPKMRRDKRIPTFAEATERVIGIREPNWRDGGKSAGQWRACLRDYAFSQLGPMAVDSVGPDDVARCLEPIWHKKPETARKLAQRVSAVLTWAVSQNYRPDNPVPAVRATLGSNRNGKQHFAALHWSKVGRALAVVAACAAYPVTKLALRFIVLTACRSGEARLATWAEIDCEQAVWTIPGIRTKTGKEHRVPLSAAALSVLGETRGLGSDLLFPSPTGKALSDSTISKLLRENDVASTVHGFRSSFRDWAGESGQDRELAERSLGHVLTATESAYARSDLLERRRTLLEAWAQVIAG